MNRTWTTREVIRLVIVVALASGILLGTHAVDRFGIGGSAYGAESQTERPPAARKCVDDTGAPCYNVVNAFNAGVVGSGMTVPDNVRTMVRQAVHREGRGSGRS
jgi:hypothetical protein